MNGWGFEALCVRVVCVLSKGFWEAVSLSLDSRGDAMPSVREVRIEPSGAAARRATSGSPVKACVQPMVASRATALMRPVCGR